MPASSIILTVAVPVFLFLAGLAFSKPQTYLDVLSEPISKFANTIIIVLFTYTVSIVHFSLQAIDFGLEEDKIVAVREQLLPMYHNAEFFISAFCIGYIPSLIASYTKRKEVERELKDK